MVSSRKLVEKRKSLTGGNEKRSFLPAEGKEVCGFLRLASAWGKSKPAREIVNLSRVISVISFLFLLLTNYFAQA